MTQKKNKDNKRMRSESGGGKERKGKEGRRRTRPLTNSEIKPSPETRTTCLAGWKRHTAHTHTRRKKAEKERVKGE
jgi:hypothetical protein